MYYIPKILKKMSMSSKKIVSLIKLLKYAVDVAW